MAYEKNTSRFYQMGNAALCEYKFNNYSNTQTSGEYGMRSLSDFSPFVYNLLDGEKLYVDTLQPDDCSTGNVVTISSIPYDKSDSVKFRITDTSISYADYEYCNKKFGGNEGVLFDSSTDMISFDTVRIYYVNGYDFDTVDGVYMNISVNSDDGTKVTLCKMYIRKNQAYGLFKYLERPMIVSNRIFDKYFEFKVPAVKFLCNSYYKTIYELAEYLNVSESTPVHVEYGEVTSENIIDYEATDSSVFDAIDSFRNKPTIPYNAILYSTSNVYTCALPQYANSDNITCKLAINEEDGCLDFCGQWMGEDLDLQTVNEFNRSIVLYDVNSNSRNNANYYDTNADNSTEWVGYHEIISKFYADNDEIIDALSTSEQYRQIYTFTQPFDKDGILYELYKNCLRYKPLINKDVSINNAVFEYNFRLVNLLDDVQFLRTATLTVSGNDINKYFVKTLNLDLSNIKTYNVYNKIEQVSQNISTPIANPVGTQYTKVFYNVSDIVLDNNGEYIESDKYVLNLSDSPKNYKFKFRKYDADGNLIIYDLSDYSLVLYTRDVDGKDIVIEPTYSSNMNLIMGELEFNMSVNNILKLKNVDSTKRFMSILVVNNDNTKYSMFDFTYE